jgi:hypothetical protein
MPNYINEIAIPLMESCKNCSVSYNPEFIAQGDIVRGFENPDIILVGTTDEFLKPQLIEIYSRMVKNTPQFHFMTPLDAEIVKISLNGFITTKISFANMISDLCDEIWKNKENCFMDVERVKKDWYEAKIVILNSKILENLLTNSLKLEFSDDVKKLENGLKKADGTVKMKLFKTIVEKMGSLERTLYFFSNNGNNFNVVPSRDFFRKYYNDIELNFDYHVKFHYNEDDEESNDFKINLNLRLDDDNLIDMIIFIKFTGGELSSKLSAKYKFELVDNFNYKIAQKRLSEFEPKNNEESSS